MMMLFFLLFWLAKHVYNYTKIKIKASKGSLLQSSHPPLLTNTWRDHYINSNDSNSFLVTYSIRYLNLQLE